ncbi:hypothetical protein RB200_20345 [Streptomyces sp. PmtG]
MLDEKHLAEGAIIADLSFFTAGTESAIVAGRDDLLYIRGGVLSVPEDSILPRGFNGSLNTGELLAGVAETVVLALSGAGGEIVGDVITLERVSAIVDLARAARVRGDFHLTATGKPACLTIGRWSGLIDKG